MNKLISVKQAAEILKVHPNTIRKLIVSEEITAVRIGQRVLRIDESSLLELIRNKKTD